MTEYVEKYIDLWCFALEVMMNKLKKVWRFDKGLRPELFHQVVVFALPTYQAVLEKAQLVETLYREHTEYSRGITRRK